MTYLTVLSLLLLLSYSLCLCAAVPHIMIFPVVFDILDELLAFDRVVLSYFFNIPFFNILWHLRVFLLVWFVHRSIV